MQWCIFLCRARALHSLQIGTLSQEQTQGKLKGCACNRSHSLSPFSNERNRVKRIPFNRRVAAFAAALTYLHTDCRVGFQAFLIFSTYPVSKLFMITNLSTAQKYMTGIILTSSDSCVCPLPPQLAAFPKSKNW